MAAANDLGIRRVACIGAGTVGSGWALVRFEKVHRAVQMVQLQPLAPLDAYVFAQPLLMAVQLRRRRVGHQSQTTPARPET